jgi:hypothetical protein
MIQTYANDNVTPSDDLKFDNFKILKDFSRTVERGGKVVRGKYSDGRTTRFLSTLPIAVS